MRQIIPFKQDLLFKTKISEITSISLEHSLSLKEDDIVSGEFFISGDYKMTASSINREKFSFNLPFEIQMDSKYDVNSMVIDIDNFYYEVVDGEILSVNIDVFVEGDKVLDAPALDNEVDLVTLNNEDDRGDDDTVSFDDLSSITNEDDMVESINYISSINNKNINDNAPINVSDSSNTNDLISYKTDSNESDTNDLSSDIDIKFNPFNDDSNDTYVTYRVYMVRDNDTIDTIINKFNVSKEIISDYNDISTLVPGDKVIIPNSSCDE